MKHVSIVTEKVTSIQTSTYISPKLFALAIISRIRIQTSSGRSLTPKSTCLLFTGELGGESCARIRFRFVQSSSEFFNTPMSSRGSRTISTLSSFSCPATDRDHEQATSSPLRAPAGTYSTSLSLRCRCRAGCGRRIHPASSVADSRMAVTHTNAATLVSLSSGFTEQMIPPQGHRPASWLRFQ